MTFFIGVLTFFLVINCLVLILLVLMQLPKKDAGADAGIWRRSLWRMRCLAPVQATFLPRRQKYATIVFFATWPWP